MYIVWREGLKEEDDIKMDIKVVVGEVAYWMHLAQERYQWRSLVSTVVNLWVREISLL
jgi:hypothetical protein